MSYVQEAQVAAGYVQTVEKRSIKFSTRTGLVILLLLAFLHGALYALFLPPWGLIDEAQHLHYIQYIAEQHALPVTGNLYLSDEIVASLFATRRWETFHWTPPPSLDPRTMGLEGYSYEAYQPPLFYLTMVPLYLALPHDILVKVYGLRLAVVMLSLITVWALYRTAKILFPQYPQLPFLAGLLLVAIPERAIATSRINNDILLEVLAALFIMVLTHAAVAGLTARRSLLLGLLLGLALWVKIPAGLLVIPLLLLLWLHRRDQSWRRHARWLLVVLPFGAAMAARNLLLYGDLTGFSAYKQLDRLAQVDMSLSGFVSTLISVPNHLWLLWWKGSDVGSNSLVTAFYWLMAIVVAGSAGRLLLYFWRQRSKRPYESTFVVALLYVVTVLVYIAAVIYSYYSGMVPVIQGRFLLPAMLPFVLLLAWGLWLYPWGEKIILAVVVVLWGMGIFSLFGNLVPYYYYWSDVFAGIISTHDPLSIGQWLTLVYQRTLMDKPSFLAPILLVLPFLYGVALLSTLVVALRTINPPRRWFPQGTLAPASDSPSTASVIPAYLVGPSIKLDLLVRYLLPASMVYLALPHFIFFLGWLQWPFALLVSLIMGMAIVSVSKALVDVSHPQASLVEESADRAPSAENRSAWRFTRQHALMIGLICVLWLIFAGIGGILRQDYDWDKHNVILNSLIMKPWPTIFEIYQEKLPLVYYLGYYLPPALVGKIGGWVGANLALFVWSLAGLLLAVAWFCILVGRVSLSALLIFVAFSGLDVIGEKIVEQSGIWNAGKASWVHMEPWTGIWQYSSNTTLLFWVPHQALSGWVLAGITLYCLVTLRRRDFILLPLGLSAFWSPFVTLGMIPYLVIDFFLDKEPLGVRIRRMITFPNAAGLMAIGITIFYLSSRFYESSPIIINNTFVEWSLPTFDGPMQTALIFLLLFCFLEFGVYAIILYTSGGLQDKRWRWMLHITVFTLCLLPWFKYGAFNDLVMRASIPALFVLAVIVTQVIHDVHTALWARIALVIVLLVGAITPGVEFARHIKQMRDYLPPLIDETQVPRNFVDYFKTDTFFFGQYTGGIESPFFKYAAKAEPANAETGAEMVTNHHDYVLYDNKIYLLRDKLEAAVETTPGGTFVEPLPLDFYGIAIRSDYKLSARLEDKEGNLLWHIEDWPAEHPPIEAFHLTSWIGSMAVTIPITATPGLYDLKIGFYDAKTQEYLPARSVPDETPLGELVPVVSVQVK